MKRGDKMNTVKELEEFKKELLEAIKNASTPAELERYHIDLTYCLEELERLRA
jgi:hypothetical protein